jgi:hypothetical protein
MTIFSTGAPSKDPKHPDYVPNIFPHTKGRKGNADLYEKRQERILAREMRKKYCSDAINGMGSNHSLYTILDDRNKTLLLLRYICM